MKVKLIVRSVAFSLVYFSMQVISPVFAQDKLIDKIEGFVYEDVNQNGKKDRREKGLAQVAI